jgi:dolichyl-phosphate-mannose-protein mannosyltransferase
MAALIQYITPTLLIPIAVLAALFCFFAYYWRAMSPRDGTLEWVGLASAARPRASFSFTLHPMEWRDALPLLLLTVLYAATAFFQLGSFTNPQSFAQLTAQESITITLADSRTLSRILYYPGLNTGGYRLEISADGETWYTLRSYEKNEETDTPAYYAWVQGAADDLNPSLSHKYSEMFKWLEVAPKQPISVKHLRLTGLPAEGKPWLEMGELALYDDAGRRITGEDIAQADEKAAFLLDEQGTVPDAPSWYNSSYFDEIYHPRTALEHIRNIYPYEITHPPLGKLLMGLGIRLFGMTPFGWRFIGTLFGVGMVPLLYVFLKNLFGKTLIAVCGTAVFTFDFMHLTQTRIATIDTYGVFFILAMYFFMYRYLTLPAGTSFRKGAPALFLSGLMWGIGAASKWTVIYGAAGLAILYFTGLYFKWRDWPRDEGTIPFGPWLTKTLLFSVLCFAVIPAGIYTLSYIPYAAAQGEITVQSVIKAMAENQKYMLNYHKGVNEPHGYSSRWYQWIVDGRPILYYLDTSREAATGLKTAFGAFNNPIVSWAGLLAIVTLICRPVADFLRRRGGGMAAPGLPALDGKAIFILVGYFSQLVPWMFIFRTTFAYHYFPSMLFLALALAYVMDGLTERKPIGWRWAVYGLTGSAVAQYAAFYPVLIGLAVPSWYTTYLLRWLPSWPF